MSEKSNAFVNKASGMIREITDPAELQRQLRELVEQDFPVARPVFAAGETMPMHEFLSRYQKNLCGGVVPNFYGSTVHVLAHGPHGLSIEIEPA